MALMFEVDAEKYTEASAVFRQLETVVRSHFGYEETQLEEAIGVLGVGVYRYIDLYLYTRHFMQLSKFDARPLNSTTLDTKQFEPFRFRDLWQLEVHKTFSRLRIGPASRQIGLALDLCKTWGYPVWVLVVVVASRDEWKEGRYQAPHPVSFDEAEMLLWEYQELFEQDGRLNLWIGSSETNDLLVIDRHNLIYVYGDLETAQTTLTDKGLSEGEVAIPYPHTHHYHAKYDQTFRTLLAHWDWVFSELKPEDDD